jgi:hypothetical protein
MNARRTLRLVVALLLVGPAAVAQPAAAPAQPSLAESLHGLAHDTYDSARLLLTNKDYGGALTKFQQAYELSKDPRLLFDMAVCAKGLHAYAKMKALLEQYERAAAGTMSVEDRAAVDAALAAVKNLVGVLRLAGVPEGATVLLDGVSLGTSPLKEPVFVDMGRHTVGVSKVGFDPAEKVVDVSGGGVIEIELALSASTRAADLVVAAPDGATVALDGKIAGVGRVHDKVAPGRHEVRVTAPGKLPYERPVELRGGEASTLDVTLEDEKHGGSAWPWIVGGVVVVAAGAVGGYFLFKPSDTTTPPPIGRLGGVTFSSAAGAFR